VLALFGWRIEAEVPDEPKLVLIAAPHTSNWDFLLAMATIFALGIRVSWMGKHTMFRWPFKRFLIWIGGVPTDRTAAQGTVQQTIDIFDRCDKFILGLAPEGTRSHVGRWKTGFYHVARGANVPVVMVRLDYGRKVLGIGPSLLPSGDIEADMARIQSFFAGVKGKFPSRRADPLQRGNTP
jgi:1-acyl-sn-glycerol-3-phosphate acyltransferase